MFRDLVRGAASGLLATTAMSAVMLAGDRAGLMPDQPPKRIVRAFMPGHRHRPKQGEKALGTLTHFAFGTACGAAFGVLCRKRRAPVTLGVGYGLAIWAVSYQGWVPMMGILPPISDDRPGRPAVMGAAHVVYGATLALAVNGIRRSAGPAGPGSGDPRG
ncbi:DUF6789 family protein [Streptosporangium sp. NPDC023615]|uniref:DUF6789 family protein n=1 Tax=Streptosporangium sp. NPDC023615 TaxID=3154794 RepID=UPI003427D67D